VSSTSHPDGVSHDTPTAQPQTGITGTPTAQPPGATGQTPVRLTTSAYECTQGWTKAMSVSTPSITGDDIEMIADLRNKYWFCNMEQIVAIR